MDIACTLTLGGWTLLDGYSLVHSVGGRCWMDIALYTQWVDTVGWI